MLFALQALGCDLLDLENLLKLYGIEEYSWILRQNKIDLGIIGQLTTEDLREMGVTLGDRKRFQLLANDLKNKVEIRAAMRLPGLPSAADLGENLSEIRQITVLFADLVGSTPLAERLEVEDYHLALTAFHECCTNIVHENSGMPARFIGDAILACFGYPAAGEDDANRAIRAGTQIIEQMPHVPSPDAEPLCARVGIATGLAMTGDLMGVGRESFGPATGAILNLASRLQTLAQPGTVFVDQTTRNLAHTDFRFTDIGERQLKGFAEAQRVWRVDGTEDAENSDIDLAGRVTPLVGRREELDLLQNRWRTADRKGSVVLVSGEAGIGKSRLISEFIDLSGLADTQVLRMECLANETLRPLHPVIKLIESIAGSSATSRSVSRNERLRAWVDNKLKLSPETADVLAQLIAPAENTADDDTIDPKTRKARTFTTLVQIIERLGVEEPRLIVLEDIHWIDPTTQEFLDHLVERIADLGVLVVCTYRPPDHRPSFIGEARVSLISLSRLEAEQSAQVMQGVLGNTALPLELAQRIVARADGVPLFVEELTKSAMETGFEAEPGSGPAGQMTQQLPTTLHGLLLARLDRVPGANRIAPIGAAIGRNFAHELLLCAAGMTDTEADPILSDLVSAGLLSRRGSGGETEYSFKHALVQDAAYKTMPRGRRTRVHKRIGDILERIGGTDGPVRPEVLAYHFEAAEDKMKAYEYWRLSAVAAQRSSASEEAVAHIRSALKANEMTPKGSGKRDREIELREMLFVPFEITNWGSDEIAENLERLRALHRELSDNDKPLAVLHGLAGYHIIAGRISLARGFADEILEWYSPNDVIARALGLRCRAFCRFLVGDFSDAIADFEQVISLCEKADPEKMKRFYHADAALISHCMICWALALMRSHDGFAAKVKAAEELIGQSQIPWDQMYSLNILASCYQCHGDAENCLRILARVMPMAEDAKSDYWTGWGSILRGWATAMDEEGDANVSEIEEGLRLYTSTGSRQIVPYAKTLMADVFLKSGNMREYAILRDELRDARDPAEVRYCDVLLDRMSADML